MFERLCIVGVGLIGGSIGILSAVVIANLLTGLFGLNTVVNPSIVLLACAFSGGVGVFFGFYPARKAAALNPIDALRYQ